MGGSTDWHVTAHSTDDSEKLFNSATEEAERISEYGEGKRRNVFISFHIEDEAQVNLLRQQAKNEKFDLEFRDYSIKEPFDEAWKKQTSDRISKTSATIVMIGCGTAQRKAVEWEIREAHKQGKKVIGVRIYKRANHSIPPAMKEHGDKIVSWNMHKINDVLD